MGVVERMDNVGTFFLDNSSLIKNITEEEIDYLNGFANNNGTMCKVNNWKIKDIIKDILDEVDGTSEWLEIYLDAVNSGHIIYLNELDDESLNKLKRGLGILNIESFDNTCMHLGNKDRYLFLNYKDNLGDVIFTIHEIIHYINEILDNGRNVFPLVREFPSIFYEMYALNYLYKIGYSEEELMKVYHFRIDDLNVCIDSIRNIVDIDDVTRDILYTCYPYIIGDYLARMAIIKSKNDMTILPMMKYITENLSKIDVSDIFKLFEVSEKRRILK